MPLKPAEQVGVPLPGEKHSFPDAHADRSQLIGTPVHVGCASWGSSGWWSVKPDTSTLFSQATCRNWPTNHHRSVKYHKPQAICQNRPINHNQSVKMYPYVTSSGHCSGGLLVDLQISPSALYDHQFFQSQLPRWPKRPLRTDVVPTPVRMYT